MDPMLTTAVNMLTQAINRASEDSGKVAKRIVWLTFWLVLVGLLQVGATIFATLHVNK
jgi:hypothetical protein